MDSRLTRGMNASEAADWASWYKASRLQFEELQRVLAGAAEASRGAGDEASAFSGPNALAELAHKAGYRQGLAEAIKLLTVRQ